MSDGMKQASPLMLVEMLEREMEARESGDARREREREMTAKTMVAFGEHRVSEMSEVQKDFVKEAQRRSDQGMSDRGFGFSIPTEGRDPQVP